MGKTIQRRHLLAVGATGLLAGCYSDVSCTTGIEEQFSGEFVDDRQLERTESNVNQGGDCSRRTSTFCLGVSVTVAPEVHLVEGRTPDGETVGSQEAENGSVDYLQLAEFEPDGQRVEREIVLLDSDSRELDSATVFSECNASRPVF